MALASLGLVGLLDDGDTFLGETLKTYATATKKLLSVCTETLAKRTGVRGVDIKNPACFIQVINEESKDLYYGMPSYASAIAVNIDSLKLSSNVNDLSLKNNEDNKYIELRLSELQVDAVLSDMKYFVGSDVGGVGQWQSLPSDTVAVQGKKRFSSVDWKFNWQTILSDVSKIQMPSPSGLLDGFKNQVKDVFSKPNVASGAIAALAMGRHVVDSVCGDEKQRCGYENSSEMITSLDRSDRIYGSVIETLVKSSIAELFNADGNKKAFGK
jgi:hypothetical protein